MMRAIFLFSLALAASITGCTAEPASRSSNDPRGFYLTTRVLDDAGKVPTAASYDVAGVDGVFIRIPWDVIEPAAGRFDWQVFDAVARPAVAKRKKLSIGIVTGRSTPLWLRQAGVDFQSFAVGKDCEREPIPAVWEKSYIDAYVTMMRRLAEHLRQIGAYDAVKIVKISAIAQQTLELRLPNGSRCSESTDAEMATFGYRPSRTLAAWSAMANGTQQAFPGKLLIQPILQVQGFPAINDAGRPIPRGQVDLGDQIVERCVQGMKPTCGIQWNALKFQGPMAQRVLDAQKQGAPIGWQTNLYEGPNVGAGCQVDRRAETVPCNAASYQQLLARGVQLGATFIEVWEPDMLRYPTAFTPVARSWKM